ncbi:MAG: Holliday junction branch migration protein RuvA [Parcubacteria group bacterium]|jgi:Holliday junction DNA helicase RuvA|nr:Holliday junction branch migration protein RuvA [Parcubacteria group bacterium]|tara:strand:- start:12299 stop:12868 length:570 start_codon:yes stop_codon:yes gene_type:complete
MIGSLKGKIELKTDKLLILDVQGVGYRIFCSSATLEQLGGQGQEAKIFTHLYIRENLSDLYGFMSFEELEFFETLISVSGIGPKAALSVMMLASVETLKQAIASGQKTILTKVSGIGQRTAERIILELRDKVSASVAGIQQLSSESEVIDALIGLGYTNHQVREALKQIPSKVKKVEDRVKQALKLLGK